MKYSHKMFFIALFVLSLLNLSSEARSDWKEDWDGSIFAGYTNSSGNTDKSSGTLDVNTTKEMESARWKLGGKAFYSSSDGQMDGQEWSVFGNFQDDFGEEDRWFRNYKLLVEHDRFADIDYRITPSFGIGYHFARTEDFTWNADAGLAYVIVRYRENTSEDDEYLAAILHTFIKKKVLENAFVSEDLTVTPALESGEGFLVRSASTFSNPLTQNMDLEIKYYIDYNSEPAAGKTSTDKKLVAGLKYKF